MAKMSRRDVVGPAAREGEALEAECVRASTVLALHFAKTAAHRAGNCRFFYRHSGDAAL